MENKSLGTLIREERKRKGLTQSQLGKLIGLNAPRVSKIENGAPITPDVASFILGKMGSQLQVSLVAPPLFDEEKSSFLISSVISFSQTHSISLDRAYWYLYTFKGMDFLNEHYDIEQTLSREEINNDLRRVCANHGGML